MCRISKGLVKLRTIVGGRVFEMVVVIIPYHHQESTVRIVIFKGDDVWIFIRQALDKTTAATESWVGKVSSQV